MLFWICVIIAVVAIMFVFICDSKNWDAGFELSVGIFAVMMIIVLIMGLVLIINHVGNDAYIARMHSRYDMLVYQYENDFYENDNDVGKRELIADIQAWNEDLTANKVAQDNFWLGIFKPNIYDQFEFIELKRG